MSASEDHPDSDYGFLADVDLNEAIFRLAVRDSLTRSLEEHAREREQTDHQKVRLESIQRLKDDIYSHIHPSLVSFASEAGWLNESGTNGLLHLHWRAKDRDYKGLISPGLRTGWVASRHLQILACWEEWME